MKKSEQISNIAAALSLFQKDIKNPNNTADNRFFSSKYAPLPDIINHVKQKLSEYQLAVFQSVGGDGENVSVTTLIVHSSGEWIESDPLIIKNQEQKGVSLAQAAGISITYARRYSLSAALGISSEDDTDGNTGEQQKGNAPQNDKKKEAGNLAVKSDTISEAQAKRMFAMAKGHDKASKAESVRIVLEQFGYKNSLDVKKSDYEKICDELESMPF